MLIKIDPNSRWSWDNVSAPCAYPLEDHYEHFCAASFASRTCPFFLRQPIYAGKMSSQNPPLVRHSLFSIHAGGRIHISLTMFSLLLAGVAGFRVALRTVLLAQRRHRRLWLMRNLPDSKTSATRRGGNLLVAREVGVHIALLCKVSSSPCGTCPTLNPVPPDAAQTRLFTINHLEDLPSAEASSRSRLDLSQMWLDGLRKCRGISLRHPVWLSRIRSHGYRAVDQPWAGSHT